jgi:hypothetical protein
LSKGEWGGLRNGRIVDVLGELVEHDLAGVP